MVACFRRSRYRNGRFIRHLSVRKALILKFKVYTSTINVKQRQYKKKVGIDFQIGDKNTGNLYFSSEEGRDAEFKFVGGNSECFGDSVLVNGESLKNLCERVKVLEEMVKQMWYSPGPGGPEYQQGLASWNEKLKKRNAS